MWCHVQEWQRGASLHSLCRSIPVMRTLRHTTVLHRCTVSLTAILLVVQPQPSHAEQLSTNLSTWKGTGRQQLAIPELRRLWEKKAFVEAYYDEDTDQPGATVGHTLLSEKQKEWKSSAQELLVARANGAPEKLHTGARPRQQRSSRLGGTELAYSANPPARHPNCAQILAEGEPAQGSSARQLDALVERSHSRALLSERPSLRKGPDNEKPKAGGQGVKNAKEHHGKDKKAIPHVLMSAVNGLWKGLEQLHTLLQENVEPQDSSRAASLQESQAPVFEPSSEPLQQAQTSVQTKLNAQDFFHGSRRLLSRGLVSSRGLVGGRPNGISEMPDPEAAEYLAEHQSGDLGSDILTAAKLHYNGTQEGPVHPLSTDRHATIEEHITQATNEKSLHKHTQDSQMAPGRYASSQHSDNEDLSEQSSGGGAASDSSQQPRSTQQNQKQEGYPWYTNYPAPGFPHTNLTKTNHSIHTDLQKAVKILAAEVARRREAEQLAERAKQLQQSDTVHRPRNVADITRDSLAAESRIQTSIWARTLPRGPGDGAEPTPGSYILTTAGSGEQTPAQQARDQLGRLRQQAQLWMNSQEASLIESFLSAEDAMLEFGAGYSTMWFSQFVKAYYSVEHNATWFDEIKAEINATRKNVYLQVAPVEKGHKGWGGGFEEGTYQQFEHYILSVENFKVTRFDKILIDGRARASCAEYVLKFLHAGSLVFIHDYQDRYFYHGTVEQYYDKVAETYDGQSIVVLRPKPEALKRAAREAVAGLTSQ